MTSITSRQRQEWMIIVAVAAGFAAGSAYADRNPWPAQFRNVETRNNEPRPVSSLSWDKGEGDGDDYAAAVRKLHEQDGFRTDECVGKSRSARAAHAAVVRERNGSNKEAQLPGAVGESWSTRSGAFETRKEEDRGLSNVSWDNASRMCSSPRDICKVVKDRVKYSRDMQKEDEWRGGEDTWNKGKGDCDDYAVAVRDLCEREGFKAVIYVVYSKTARAAHAVTIGERNGTMWLSSNGLYEEVQSLDDAKETLARDLGWWAPDVDVYKAEDSPASGDRSDMQPATQYLER